MVNSLVVGGMYAADMSHRIRVVESRDGWRHVEIDRTSSGAWEFISAHSSELREFQDFLCGGFGFFIRRAKEAE